MKNLFLSLSLISSLVFAGTGSDQLENAFAKFNNNLIAISKNKDKNEVMKAMMLNINQLLQKVSQLAQQYDKNAEVNNVVEHLMANVQNIDQGHLVQEIKKRAPQLDITGAEPEDLCMSLFFIELEEIFQDC